MYMWPLSLVGFCISLVGAVWKGRGCEPFGSGGSAGSRQPLEVPSV